MRRLGGAAQAKFPCAVPAGFRRLLSLVSFPASSELAKPRQARQCSRKLHNARNGSMDRGQQAWKIRSYLAIPPLDRRQRRCPSCTARQMSATLQATHGPRKASSRAQAAQTPARVRTRHTPRDPGKGWPPEICEIWLRARLQAGNGTDLCTSLAFPRKLPQLFFSPCVLAPNLGLMGLRTRRNDLFALNIFFFFF